MKSLFFKRKINWFEKIPKIFQGCFSHEISPGRERRKFIKVIKFTGKIVVNKIYICNLSSFFFFSANNLSIWSLSSFIIKLILKDYSNWHCWRIFSCCKYYINKTKKTKSNLFTIYNWKLSVVFPLVSFSHHVLVIYYHLFLSWWFFLLTKQ